MSKHAATEERAGKLHEKIFDILHEMTEPIIIEKEDGTVERFYDKDYVKMSLAALKENKITVVETSTNTAGTLRTKLAKKGAPRFGQKIVPMFATEEDCKEESKCEVQKTSSTKT